MESTSRTARVFLILIFMHQQESAKIYSIASNIRQHTKLNSPLCRLIPDIPLNNTKDFVWVVHSIAGYKQTVIQRKYPVQRVVPFSCRWRHLPQGHSSAYSMWCWGSSLRTCSFEGRKRGRWNCHGGDLWALAALRACRVRGQGISIALPVWLQSTFSPKQYFLLRFYQCCTTFRLRNHQNTF